MDLLESLAKPKDWIIEQKQKRKCYGCKHLRSEWNGDGSTTFKCGRTVGLVVGHVGAFDDDEPFEANGCYNRD